MKTTVLFLLILAAALPAQMEKRLRVLYDREAFRKRAPAVGKALPNLTLRDLDGKKRSFASFGSKPLVIIGGAFT